MNHIWDKIKRFFLGSKEDEIDYMKIKKEEFDEMMNEAVNKAVYEERKYHEIANTAIDSSDNFYVFQEAIDPDRIKFFNDLYAKNKRKELFEGKLKNEFVDLIASTGWTPSGFESAAYRAGTSDEITSIQDACFKKYTIDPLGRNAVMNYQYFVIGKGIRVTSPVSEVDNFIQSFRALNKMTNREKKMIRSCFIEGEYFLKYLIVNNKVYLRKIEPCRIKDVVYDSDDIEKVYGYKVENIEGNKTRSLPGINLEGLISDFGTVSFTSGSPTNNEFIQHIKYGEEEFLRGSPPMYSVLRFLKYYDDWLIDRIRLNHERAKVVWIRENTGSKLETSTNPMSAPKGGIMLQESNNVKYRIESAKLDSADASKDGLAILYMIGSGLNMPIHVLNQRTDQAVYASIKKSDSPFSQMIEDAQEMWREEFDTMYRFALSKSDLKNKKFEITVYKEEAKQEAMKKVNEMVIDKQPSDRIIEDVTKILEKGKETTEKVGIDKVPINQIFPQMVKEDSLEQAKVLFLHKKMGIVSYQTASERAGYDWREELARKSQEDFNDKAGTGISPEDDEDGMDEIPGLSDDSQGGEPKLM